MKPGVNVFLHSTVMGYLGIGAGLSTIAITLSEWNQWLRFLGAVGTLVVLVLTIVSLWRDCFRK